MLALLKGVIEDPFSCIILRSHCLWRLISAKLKTMLMILEKELDCWELCFCSVGRPEPPEVLQSTQLKLTGEIPPAPWTLQQQIKWLEQNIQMSSTN
jgi:hypothetical protein